MPPPSGPDPCGPADHRPRPGRSASTTGSPRIPAAPSRSICTDTPGVRDSGWHPGPEPKVSRSSADQVAAGTPVWWAAIADRHRRPDRATPAADAITACNGGTGHRQPSTARTAASVRIHGGACGPIRRRQPPVPRRRSRDRSRFGTADRGDQPAGRRRSHPGLGRGGLPRVRAARPPLAATRARRRTDPSVTRRSICSQVAAGPRRSTTRPSGSTAPPPAGRPAASPPPPRCRPRCSTRGSPPHAAVPGTKRGPDHHRERADGSARSPARKDSPGDVP